MVSRVPIRTSSAVLSLNPTSTQGNSADQSISINATVLPATSGKRSVLVRRRLRMFAVLVLWLDFALAEC
jgi:hypothetical protein